MKLGSLFDGIGGFPLAAIGHNIKPVWASEIEPFPVRVTEKHFPEMKHLGNITQINGAEIEPVDIITFGSPCQDLSIAGKGAGLEGERSSLFFEAIRIIKEMRTSTNGSYPRFAIWENVPGALSSNKGEDFKEVIRAFIEIGALDITWRVLDAQYFGVPQRRRRVFLVADFRGCCAGEILFEPESLSGDIEKGRKERKETAGSVGNGVKESVHLRITGTQCASGAGLNRSADRHAVCYGIDQQGGKGGANYTEDVAPTLLSDSHGTPHAVAIDRHAVAQKTYSLQGSMIGRADKNGPQGSGINEDISFTLNTTDRHAVAYGEGSYGQYNEGQVSTLKASGGCLGGGGETLISDYTVRRLTPTECLRLQGFPDDWLDDIKGNSDTAKYKAIGNRHMVARPQLASGGPVTGTLMANAGTKLWLGNQEAFSGNYSIIHDYAVRRLTPIECLRLQGFPDNWLSGLSIESPSKEDISFWLEVFETHRQALFPEKKPKTEKQIITWLKKLYSDTVAYKAIGNSLAVPVVDWIFRRLVNVVGE